MGEIVFIEEFGAPDLPFEKGIKVKNSGAAVENMYGWAGMQRVSRLMFCLVLEMGCLLMLARFCFHSFRRKLRLHGLNRYAHPIAMLANHHQNYVGDQFVVVFGCCAKRFLQVGFNCSSDDAAKLGLSEVAVQQVGNGPDEIREVLLVHRKLGYHLSSNKVAYLQVEP